MSKRVSGGERERKMLGKDLWKRGKGIEWKSFVSFDSFVSWSSLAPSLFSLHHWEQHHQEKRCMVSVANYYHQEPVKNVDNKWLPFNFWRVKRARRKRSKSLRNLYLLGNLTLQPLIEPLTIFWAVRHERGNFSKTQDGGKLVQVMQGKDDHERIICF